MANIIENLRKIEDVENKVFEQLPEELRLLATTVEGLLPRYEIFGETIRSKNPSLDSVESSVRMLSLDIKPSDLGPQVTTLLGTAGFPLSSLANIHYQAFDLRQGFSANCLYSFHLTRPDVDWSKFGEDEFAPIDKIIIITKLLYGKLLGLQMDLNTSVRNHLMFSEPMKPEFLTNAEVDAFARNKQLQKLADSRYISIFHIPLLEELMTLGENH